MLKEIYQLLRELRWNRSIIEVAAIRQQITNQSLQMWLQIHGLCQVFHLTLAHLCVTVCQLLPTNV